MVHHVTICRDEDPRAGRETDPQKQRPGKSQAPMYRIFHVSTPVELIDGVWREKAQQLLTQDETEVPESVLPRLGHIRICSEFMERLLGGSIAPGTKLDKMPLSFTAIL